MIITGGFNVYSAEVEQALSAYPAVRDSAVIGLPDPKWGELAGFVEERLGSVTAPEQVEIWPDLPRSTLGKILKNEVRNRLPQG